MFRSIDLCAGCGFSIKSDLGNPPTLLNAGRNIELYMLTLPLPSGTVSVKPEVNIYCQGNGKGSNAGHLGGFKDTENQVGVVSSEIFQKEAGCAV